MRSGTPQSPGSLPWALTTSWAVCWGHGPPGKILPLEEEAPPTRIHRGLRFASEGEVNREKKEQTNFAHHSPLTLPAAAPAPALSLSFTTEQRCSNVKGTSESLGGEGC